MKKIVDLHCHYNHGVDGDTITNVLYRADLPFLEAERKRHGIIATAFSSFSSVLSADYIYRENVDLAQLAQKHSWIYQWTVLDPRKQELFKQSEELLKSNKTLGIKIHSPMHQYPINDYADEIFGFANEQKTFVLMHPDAIPDMAKYADKYPNMKLIIAHIGSEEHIQAVKDTKNNNIYVDTSGIASSKNNIIEYAIKQIGSEKIFFGTDTYSCAFQRGRIEFADISKTAKKNILFQNAKREFCQLKNIK